MLSISCPPEIALKSRAQAAPDMEYWFAHIAEKAFCLLCFFIEKKSVRIIEPNAKTGRRPMEMPSAVEPSALFSQHPCNGDPPDILRMITGQRSQFFHVKITIDPYFVPGMDHTAIFKGNAAVSPVHRAVLARA